MQQLIDFIRDLFRRKELPRTTLNIAGGYYKDESYAISSRECVNFYPHIPEGQTITDGCLIGFNGIDLLYEREDDLPCRGGIGDAFPHFLAGDVLYRVTDDTVTAGITVPEMEPTITSRAMFALGNNATAFVVPEDGRQHNMWIGTFPSISMTRVTDVDFDGPASSICWSDGYFIFSKKGTNKWFISDLNDGTSYNSLDFASAESSPDNITVIKPLRGIIFVFGTRSVEQYQNVGGSGFPFERINSGTYNKGCIAPFSAIVVNDAIYFIGGGLGELPGVYVTNGGPPQKISRPSIDRVLNDAGPVNMDAAWAMNWSENGHQFISFTIPENTTFIYDITTGEWCERKSVDDDLNEIPWRVAAIFPYEYRDDGNNVNRYYVADSLGGKVGKYIDTSFDEYGEEIRGYFTAPSFDNGGRPFSVNAVELVMQTGDVPITGQGSDPVIRMSVSKSGGKTYSPEISRKVGQIGDYTKRIAWSPLGRFPRSCTLRFDISEPIKRVIVKAEVEIGR